MGASTGPLIVAALSIVALCLLAPEWWRERQSARQLRQKVTELQRKLSAQQLQLDTSRQLLIRCREQVVARSIDDLKARDAEMEAAAPPAGKKPSDEA